MRFYINSVCFEIKYSFLLIIAFSICFEIHYYLYVILFSILHEMGHFVALYLAGGRADKFTVAYYGVGLKYSSEFSSFKEIIFLLSGILINAVFAALNIKRDVNLALFIINALPIYPLDGGRIFKIILNSLFDIGTSNKLYYFISSIIILLMLIFALYMQNISLLFIAIYVLVYMINNTIS